MQLCGLSKRKRAMQALYRGDASLVGDEKICMLLKSQGNFLFSALADDGEEILVSIPEKFRHAYFFTSNTFVICVPLDNLKVKAEIKCILTAQQVQEHCQNSTWPETFKPYSSTTKPAASDNYLDTDLLPPSGSDHDDESGESSHETSDDNVIVK